MISKQILKITFLSKPERVFFFFFFFLRTVKCKNGQFQTIQFRVVSQLSSIRPIDRILLRATIPCPSGPESDANKGVLHTPRSSGITGDSLSDCLESYQDTLWERLTPLLRCSRCIP